MTNKRGPSSTPNPGPSPTTSKSPTNRKIPIASTTTPRFLLKGEDPVTAAQHAFGDLNQLQHSLQDYIQQGNFSAFRVNSAVTVDAASFQLRPVSTPEADAVRADVLVYNQRTKDAEALLETSLRDDPNNALAHETMGFLKFRERDIPAAKKWYGEAVQLDSHSYLAHYYFAVMSLQAGDKDHDAEIESSLRASIKLNPSFAPSYDALANFLATRHQHLDEAHMLNVQAVELEPENLAYRLNTANVLSQQRNYASAIGVLKFALTVTKDSDPGRDGPEPHQPAPENPGSRSTAPRPKPQQPGIQTGNQSAAAPLNSINDPTKTVVFRKVDGKIAGVTEDKPNYPTEDSKGPQHTVKGVLRDIRCSYPTVLALTVDGSGKQTTLYTNNYYKVVFTTANYEPDGDIKPCTGIEDMKASVKYAEVTDKNVAGQILAIELSK